MGIQEKYFSFQLPKSKKSSSKRQVQCRVRVRKFLTPSVLTEKSEQWRNHTITCSNFYSLVIRAWAKPAYCSRFQRMHSTPLSFPQLVLTSKSGPSNWTAKRSNYKFGTRRDRSGSGPLRQLIIEAPWAYVSL